MAPAGPAPDINRSPATRASPVAPSSPTGLRLQADRPRGDEATDKRRPIGEERSSMRRFMLGAALIGAFLLVTPDGPHPVAHPGAARAGRRLRQKLAKISQALKKEVEDGSFRGAVVMVASKGKLVYQDAVGVADNAAASHDRRLDLPHLLDDQADGLGRRDDAGRGRHDPAHRSGNEVPARASRSSRSACRR